MFELFSESKTNCKKCFLSIAFFQKQTVAVIQGVAAVVTASIPAVDENVNYKALVECVFILNSEYFSVQNAAFLQRLFDLTEIQLACETIHRRKLGTRLSSYLSDKIEGVFT